jgi:hypothetical protein
MAEIQAKPGDEMRTAMLSDGWLSIHRGGYPLAVHVKGVAHVLIFLSEDQATEGAATLKQDAFPIACRSRVGNLTYQKARASGNRFAIVDGGKVCPIKTAVHWPTEVPRG